MKKGTIVILMAITVILSAVGGYSGTYLANLEIGSVIIYEEVTAATTRAETIPLAVTTAPIDSTLIESAPAPIESKPAPLTPLTIPEIAALNSKSVVEIYTESLVTDWFMRQYITEGAGSGVIISLDGYIVTNNHVIEKSTKITVQLNNGEEYDAELIGRDVKTDLAVLKINAKGLKPAKWGDSSELIVGELAVAIGNPLGKLGGTVTEGIISALSREINIDRHVMTLMQTTAAVNPGNSGGGLFNDKGELIGIVNAKFIGSDIEGIGFAIPADLAKEVVERLIKGGTQNHVYYY